MNRRAVLALIAVAMILAMTACGPGGKDRTPTPTATPPGPMIMCTPPPCDQRTEKYYCRSECPGGCGTVCATFTPER